MKSKSNLYKFCKIVIYVMVICILLTVSLHKTSTALKYYMFSDPNTLEDWEDHIQIAILLKGKYYNFPKIFVIFL